MLESSKGVSSVVMASWLGISQKSAWKICHALRLLLSQRHECGQLLTGTVELDEKYFGGAPRFKKGVKHKRGKGTAKQLIGIAAQRLGPVRAVLLESDSEANLREFAGSVVNPEARIMSDAAGGYAKIGKDFSDHRSVVHHKKEFAQRDDDLDEVVHSNTAEAFGSMLERALIGVFHLVGKQHIYRYLDEAVFRWNQRSAVLDDDGKLLGFDKLSFEDQLKKIARRAPGSELRFSDIGGICSPEERRQQTASRQGAYRILPGCGWVQFKGRRKKGVRAIEPVTPDDATRKAFWSRYPDRPGPRIIYRTTEETA
ncbi:MAG: hypothetical protein Tsb0032_22620 [Kiloniellaceae bacterium]